ncbi:MAG: efflux RND transporter periplasmic adaptor subunit, partial [Anaerolineae bacterium]
EEALKQLEEGADSRAEVYQSDLRIHEIAVKQVQAELAQLRKGVDPLLALEVQRAQQELDWLAEGVDPVLVNDVNQARLALERLQGLVADAQIVAPVDGEVVSLSLFPGRLIEAFRVGIVIADSSAIEVIASLTDQQMKALTEGQRATVVLGTTPDRTWEGTIHCLPYPYGTCGSANDPAGFENAVRISLAGDTDDLKMGALVQVIVVLEEKEDVLWLSPAAIRSFQGRTFVIVEDDGRQRRIDIELGIEGQEQVEILRGLKEGQVVVAP